MSMYAIDAVRMNPRNGLIEKVRWGKIDFAHRHWEVEPIEGDIAEVVQKIEAGEEVRATFPVGHFTVLGPRLEIRKTCDDGTEIEVIDPSDHPGRTIGDMQTF